MSNDSYRPQLDSLRAAAVVGVLIHHFLPVEKIIPDNFLTLGLLAVRLFFVLSGYLITGILLRYRKIGFRAALKRFYIRRALRILPIYYLTVAIAAVAVPNFRRYVVWHLFYGSNILAIVHPAAFVWHLWTLAVEEQFYFVWPFLILLTPYRQIGKVILATIALSICWKTVVAYTEGDVLIGAILTPACLDSLGIGALLAFIENDGEIRVYREDFLLFSLRAGVAIVVLQTLAFLSGHGLRLFWSTSYLGVSLIFVWLIGNASSGFGGVAGKILEWGPLLYVGRISYGLYLYHFFMIDVLRHAEQSLSIAQRSTLLTFLLESALSFATAVASWNLIEKPIARWKNTFDNKQSYEQSPPLGYQRSQL